MITLMTDWMLTEEEKWPDTTPGGLSMPNPNPKLRKAKILSIGPTSKELAKAFEIISSDDMPKVGDTVIFHASAGIEYTEGYDHFLILKQDAPIAKENKDD